MSAYYNDNDPYVCRWLENLIGAGLIPKGDVDCRSVGEVDPDDLRGYAQCHFFAGIGGWAYALRLAGWPDDRPVWTGSCPCQPFSVAGKGKASGDERHLWPEWFRLIRSVRPPVVFGEQVEAAIGWGWLDLVQSDLEAEDYAVGSTVLPACGVGAPHVRNRLWFFAVSHTNSLRRKREWQTSTGTWIEQQFAGLVQDQIQLSVPSGRLRSLVDGVSGHVAKLRALGNAIVPQVAAEFIKATM